MERACLPAPTPSFGGRRPATTRWSAPFNSSCSRARPHFVRNRLPTLDKPPGTVRASFFIERQMPEAMSLLAGDLVHNTRVALDHTVARLKERFGGNPGSGGFP